MTPQQIVGLGIRLFAIWLALDVANWLLRGIGASDELLQVAYGRGALFWSVIYTALAVLLWNFPMSIAQRLIPGTSHSNTLSVPVFDAARVGCALIGLWTLAGTLQGLSWFLISALVAGGSDSYFKGLSNENRVTFAITVVQAALGLLLMFRSDWFGKIVARPSQTQPSSREPAGLQ